MSRLDFETINWKFKTKIKTESKTIKNPITATTAINVRISAAVSPPINLPELSSYPLSFMKFLKVSEKGLSDEMINLEEPFGS